MTLYHKIGEITVNKNKIRYTVNMSEYPSILLTFTAGLLSFLSPCVLPLIPSYLSILGGAGGLANLSDDNERTDRKRFILFFTALSFVIGFTVVFIIFSIIVSSTFLLMGGNSKYVQITAGIIVIVLGLNMLFDFLSFLNYEKRLHSNKKPKGLIGAFAAGTAFGAGWTPCLGPILTGVLFLAGQSGKAGTAAFYLAIYSLGFGLPFLLAAVFFDRYLVPLKWFREKLPVIKKISAVVLIIIGLLILTGRFSTLSAALQKWELQSPPQEKTQASLDFSDLFRSAGIQPVTQRIEPFDFSLQSLGGETTALSSLKGKIVILNFWATWCPPCRHEMPSMETLYLRYRDYEFEMLAVNLRERHDTVFQFIERYGYTFPVLFDQDGRVGSRYGVEAIPTSFIIDKEGKIAGRIVGSIYWDTPQMFALFDALLDINRD